MPAKQRDKSANAGKSWPICNSQPALTEAKNPTLTEVKNPTLTEVKNPTLTEVKNPTLTEVKNIVAANDLLAPRSRGHNEGNAGGSATARSTNADQTARGGNRYHIVRLMTTLTEHGGEPYQDRDQHHHEHYRENKESQRENHFHGKRVGPLLRQQ
jgi:hypothetical protein